MHFTPWITWCWHPAHINLLWRLAFMKKLKRGFMVWQVVLWMMCLLKLWVKTSKLIDTCSALVSFLERWLLRCHWGKFKRLSVKLRSQPHWERRCWKWKKITGSCRRGSGQGKRALDTQDYSLFVLRTNISVVTRRDFTSPLFCALL